MTTLISVLPDVNFTSSLALEKGLLSGLLFPIYFPPTCSTSKALEHRQKLDTKIFDII